MRFLGPPLCAAGIAYDSLAVEAKWRRFIAFCGLGAPQEVEHVSGVPTACLAAIGYRAGLTSGKNRRRDVLHGFELAARCVYFARNANAKCKIGGARNGREAFGSMGRDHLGRLSILRTPTGFYVGREPCP